MTQPEISPFVLARVSAKPPALLEDLCLTETFQIIDEIALIERLQAEWTSRLEDCLFRSVPAFEHAPTLRHSALELKRAVHNARVPRLSLDLVEGTAAALAADDAALLMEWLRSVQTRDQKVALGKAILEDEIRRAGEALAYHLSDEDLRCGLALASPDFAESLLRVESADALQPAARLARSCFSYLARCSVKTSPFSKLTNVGMTSFSDPVSETERPVRRTMFHSSRALAMLVLQACCRDRRLAPAFHFEPNPSLHKNGNRWLMLTPNYLHSDGLFYRQERVVNVSGYVHQIDAALKVGTAGYAAYVTAIGGSDPHSTLVRMLSTAIVRPVAPWSRRDPFPLRTLALRLQSLDDPFAKATSERLLEVTTAIDRMGGPSVRERLRAIREVRSRTSDILGTLRQVPPVWLKESILAYENVAGASPIPQLGSHVQQDLRRLGDMMRPFILRSKVYDELTCWFVHLYGPGATCTNVFGFLTNFSERPDFRQVMERCLDQDREAIKRPNHPQCYALVGPSSVPATASVFFQLAAQDLSALQSGEYLMIVNQYNPGLGGLLARFAPLMSDAELARFQEWVYGIRPDATPVEFPVYTEWSSLQHGGLGENPVLEWPAEGPTSEEQPRLPLGLCSLRHDPVQNTLTLLGPDQRPIAPAYLGVTPSYLMSGLLRLFFLLIDPWIIGHQVGWEFSLLGPPPAQPSRVEHFPREQVGRIVLRRARWRVPVAEFPVPAPGEEPFHFLTRAEAWRHLHGIPQEVFVSQERRDLSLEAKKRKPMWVRFDCFHSLVAAKQLLEGGPVSISVTEALPGKGGHWLEGNAGASPLAAEFLVLLRWPNEVNPAQEEAHMHVP